MTIVVYSLSSIVHCPDIWLMPFPRFFKSAKADLEISWTRSFKKNIDCNTRSRNMANTISEVLKLVKANV